MTKSRMKDFKYDMNHQIIGGVEQLKYFDRLNRAAARQQHIYNQYNDNYFQEEQNKKARNDLKQQEDEIIRTQQSDVDFQNSLAMLKNTQNMYKR
mmetsp:Transcript_38941/g.59190  ORF Transcript_38941/g.59190 Transcript_38941/m.59190 type:complete len:95 (-) Transcript_38941:211-495(-)